MNRPSRRTFLTAAAAAGTAGLAGCTDTADDALPSVPQTRLSEAGWTRLREQRRPLFDRVVDGVAVNAVTHAVRFGNDERWRRLRNATLGRVDGRLNSFFAGRVTFSAPQQPAPTADALCAATERAARDAFRRRLGARGFRAVDAVDRGELAAANGETARTTTYTAAFPVEGFRLSVGSRELSVSADAIDAEGFLAVWPDGDSVLAAGGTYAAERGRRTVTEPLTDDISVTVDVDLQFDPDQYARDMQRLVAGVT
ncbi:twin-arginine translocation signal domain-containing protein [Halobaculum sp. D14]|uniref:twin-arginine translocation signal domain-containing protein n=1 Tax=unclassified Halobaculum TaxID=2640896 RepID=UPI003EB8E963